METVSLAPFLSIVKQELAVNGNGHSETNARINFINLQAVHKHSRPLYYTLPDYDPFRTK